MDSGKRYPCDGPPVERQDYNSNDDFWTVIAIKGISTEAADKYNVDLFCSSNELDGQSSSNFLPNHEVDLRTAISGPYVDVNSSRMTINCVLRDNSVGPIRQFHIP